MTVKLYAMTCGHLGGPFDALMEGGEVRIDLPIPSFLIEHPKGRALYDTGMHPQLRTDAKTRLGERVAVRFCFVNWRTTAADVEEVMRLLAELERA